LRARASSTTTGKEDQKEISRKSGGARPAISLYSGCRFFYLYRDVLGFETFEAYCKARWDFSKRHVYRLIDSANVVDTVKSDPMGHFPDNERQCRPLTKLEPDQQRIAWQQAVETPLCSRYCRKTDRRGLSDSYSKHTG
jgi:hypothetical protein